jgi:elongator complex protein 3
MPNLPGSTYEDDKEMFDKILECKEIVPQRPGHGNYEKWNVGFDQVDGMKFYKTAVLEHTKIKEWYDNGKYVPYSEELVKDLLYDFLIRMFPWVRVNRVVRDFYTQAVTTGDYNLGLRDEMHREMIKSGTWCQDIRSREVKTQEWDGKYEIVIREYDSSEGTNYMISAESKHPHTTLYGFVKLRLDNAFNKIFPELNGAALVREVHVYSCVTKIGVKGKHVQHRGLGTTLMKKAESIAKAKNYRKIAVIAGIGARTFYKEKCGYTLNNGEGQFMMKTLN